MEGLRRWSSRSHRSSIPLVVLVMLLVAMATPAALSRGGASSGRSPVCTRGLVTVERDPRGLLPLTANSVGPATVAALRFERKAGKPLVVSASVATADQVRGPSAKFSCGARVWRRTVVVYIRLRAFLPSQSLSQRVDFVGRFKDGYHVWQVVH